MQINEKQTCIQNHHITPSFHRKLASKPEVFPAPKGPKGALGPDPGGPFQKTNFQRKKKESFLKQGWDPSLEENLCLWRHHPGAAFGLTQKTKSPRKVKVRWEAGGLKAEEQKNVGGAEGEGLWPPSRDFRSLGKQTKIFHVKKTQVNVYHSPKNYASEFMRNNKSTTFLAQKVA